MRTNVKKFLRKRLAAVLALALVLTGISFFPNAETETAQAADSSTQYVWETLTYQKEAPICATEGYFFGGWYESDQKTVVKVPVTGTSYQAKFVPADVMSVKCQVASNTNVNTEKTNVRLITTVDSLDYAKVGFRVTFKGNTLDIPMTGVLESINVDNGGAGVYNYSPNLFDLASKYYATATIQNIPKSVYAEGFLVEPYWITLDGTKVTGISRYMHVEDSYNGYINIPVYLNDTENIGAGAEITLDRMLYSGSNANATSNSQYTFMSALTETGELFSIDQLTINEEGTKVKIKVNEGSDKAKANGLLVNLRFKNMYPLAEMQSRFLFNITGSYDENTINAISIKHKNLDAARGADITSYLSSDSTIVIATKAELYGLAEFTKTDALSGKKVLLVADIDLNPNWVATSNTEATNKWKPGQVNFAGVLDGQSHTIKGIYSNEATANGLFQSVASTGVIKNITFDNFYVSSSAKKAGVIAGATYGTIENVEIKNSVIKGTTASLGSIAGTLGGSAKGIKVSNCTITGAGTYTGGLAGDLSAGAKITNVEMNNCTIKDTGYFAGGITGYAANTNNVISDVEMKNCTITGKIAAAGIATSTKAEITNVTTSDLTISGGSNATGGITGTTTGTISNVKVMGGTITATAEVGGITGKLGESGTICTAYCDATVTNSSTNPAGGIAGFVTKVGNVTIEDCWYAGKLVGQTKMGGIVGHVADAGVSVVSCHNTGAIELGGSTSNPPVGGLIGFIEMSTEGRTVLLQDSLNFSEINNTTSRSSMLLGTTFGQIYGGNSTVTVDNSYGIKTFAGGVSTGWPRTGYAQGANVLVNNSAVSGYFDDVRTEEQTKNINTCPLSFDKGDGNEYSWVYDSVRGVPRLKSFSDMPFKIVHYEE